MSFLSSLLDDDLSGRPAFNPTQGPPVAKREVYINVRRDGLRGDGTPRNPFDGSNPERLDLILNGNNASGVDGNTRIIFGPGIFQTAGSGRGGVPPGNWRGIKSGQEFIGGGMFATTIRLVLSPFALGQDNSSYIVFAANPIEAPPIGFDEVVIQDLTIDCNLGGQPPTPPYDYARIMCAAIAGYGSRIRLKRVRVINSGTRTPGFDFEYTPAVGVPGGIECFPISLQSWYTQNASNIVIEDCIVEQPFHSNGRETSFIHMGDGLPSSGTDAERRKRSFNFGGQVRNCLVDGAIVNPGPFPPITVENFSIPVGNQATITTVLQHDLKAGDRVRIVANAGFDKFATVVGDPATQWTATLDFGAAPGTPSGTITAEKFSQPSMVVALQYASGKVTVTSAFPHNRLAGDWVHIYPGGGAPLDSSYFGTSEVLGGVDTSSSLHVPELTTDAQAILLTL
jgi:hypothetical protein